MSGQGTDMAESRDDTNQKAPPSPYLVLVASILPGVGHVLQGQAMRGLQFLFFTVILGWVSVKVMPDTASFFGRHVGGIFIYGLSIIDAYRIARIRTEVWRHKKGS